MAKNDKAQCMKRKVFILLILVILLAFVYQAGFDSGNSEGDVNDFNDTLMEDYIDPVDANDLQMQEPNREELIESNDGS